MAFPPLENSDHVVVSVSIDFPSNSQQDAPFHRITYGYSHAGQAFTITREQPSLLNHSYRKLFPGRSFHKIVRFYIFILEDGYSKTGMEVTGVSLCVLF